jgi:hypothetical protein
MDITDYSEHKPENPSHARGKSSKSVTKILIIIAAIVALVILGIVLAGHKPKKVEVKPATIKTEVVAPSTDTSEATLAHYVSNGNDLNLDFDYPSNWRISPATNSNTNDQTITIDSSLATIVGADGKSSTGKVTMRIRPVNTGLTELAGNTASAAQASVQIAYAKPTAHQFQYPYIDFLHLSSGANPTAAFEEVLITGNNKFTKDQIVTDTNVAVDPIITANFYSCTVSACIGSGATAFGINNDAWNNTKIFQQTLGIFKSLQIN